MNVTWRRLRSLLRSKPSATRAERFAWRLATWAWLAQVATGLAMFGVLLAMRYWGNISTAGQLVSIVRWMLYMAVAASAVLCGSVLAALWQRGHARNVLESADCRICPVCLYPFAAESGLATCSECGTSFDVEDVRHHWARAYKIRGRDTSAS